MKQRVLVASNRGPVSFQFDENGTLSAKRGGGGMIAGLISGLAALDPGTEAVWICAALSDADRVAARQQAADAGVDASGTADGSTGSGDVPVLMLDISPQTFQGAYNDIANSTLWFVHHMLFDTPLKPRFGAKFRRDWAEYAAYNEAFAAALADQARRRAPDEVRVLIQDYHLALAPRMLRNALAGGAHAGVKVAHFSHTPWAPPDYYRLLPDEPGRAVLDGMLGADHAGFLCARWADAFMDCCQAILSAQVDRNGPGSGLVTHRGRVTEVAVHPLGIDAAALRARAAADDVEASMRALRAVAEGRKLIVRVDRTELSKNITGGLAAYRELLETWPQWRGQVVHLAFAYPSRSDLAEYRSYTEQVTRLAESINAEFGTQDWNPVLLEVKDDYARSLAACKLADVLLINPVRDGMNLVAQEGPVLSDGDCVLVLSREAGSAATLGDDALLVNPFDIGQTAAALHEALNMPPAERRRRCAALAATAAATPPATWLADQLSALGPLSHLTT